MTELKSCPLVSDADVNRHGEETDGIICESCSECNYGWHVSVNDKPYSYCPNCGKSLNRVYDADSLEKLLDDMAEFIENYPHSSDAGEWRDRLSALIERGA